MKKQYVQITLNTKVRQSGMLDTSEIDGEKVMMDLENGAYFMLNDVATRIWNITEEIKSVGEITETLLREYEIDKVTCEEQVINFITHLANRELISFV